METWRTGNYWPSCQLLSIRLSVKIVIFVKASTSESFPQRAILRNNLFGTMSSILSECRFIRLSCLYFCFVFRCKTSLHGTWFNIFHKFFLFNCDIQILNVAFVIWQDQILSNLVLHNFYYRIKTVPKLEIKILINYQK